MFRRFLSLFFSSINNTHTSVYLIGFVSLFVYFFALIRNWLLATSFGAGAELDIYFASFKIADILYIIIASFVSAYALVPLFEKKQAESQEVFQSTINAVFTLFSLLLLFFSTLTFFLIPYIADTFFQAFVGTERETFILLSRLLLLQAAFFGLSAFFSSVTQFHRQFFVYALVPAFYNIGIIFGILVLYPPFGLSGLIVGVIVGAFLHLLLNTLSARKNTPIVRFTRSKEKLCEAFRYIRTSSVRSVALTMDKISLFFLASIATSLTAGSLSVFSFADDIRSVPFVLIGISCSVASIRTLAALNREGKVNELKIKIENLIAHITLFALPATVALIVYRAQIVRLFLGDGAFDWVDTRLTAAVLAILALSILAKSIIHFMGVVFYSINNTVIPFCINTITAVLLIGTLYGVLYLFEQYPLILLQLESILRVKGVPGSEIAALAVAETSVVLCAMAVFLMIVRSKRLVSFTVLFRPFVIHTLAAAAFGVVSYGVLHTIVFMTGTTTIFGLALQFLVAGGIATAVWAFFLYKTGDRAFRECLNVCVGALPYRIRASIRGTP